MIINDQWISVVCTFCGVYLVTWQCQIHPGAHCRHCRANAGARPEDLESEKSALSQGICGKVRGKPHFFGGYGMIHIVSETSGANFFWVNGGWLWLRLPHQRVSSTIMQLDSTCSGCGGSVSNENHYWSVSDNYITSWEPSDNQALWTLSFEVSAADVHRKGVNQALLQYHICYVVSIYSDN